MFLCSYNKQPVSSLQKFFMYKQHKSVCPAKIIIPRYLQKHRQIYISSGHEVSHNYKK